MPSALSCPPKQHHAKAEPVESRLSIGRQVIEFNPPIIFHQVVDQFSIWEDQIHVHLPRVVAHIALHEQNMNGVVQLTLG